MSKPHCKFGVDTCTGPNGKSLFICRDCAELEEEEAAKRRTSCIHCGEPILDNGTVYVHLKATTLNGKGMIVQTQWCDETKETMAESKLSFETHAESPELGGIIDAFDGLPNDIACDESMETLRKLINQSRGGYMIVPARAVAPVETPDTKQKS